MQSILHAPMLTDGGPEFFGVGGQRGDVEAPFPLSALLCFPAGDDHDDGAQACPLVILPQPGDIADGEDLAGFDAAMPGIGADRARDGDIFEIARHLLCEQVFHVGPQGCLIALRPKT